MDLVRVFFKADGSVSTIEISERMRLKEETDQELLDRVVQEDASGSGLDGLEYTDMRFSDLPDKTKRYKWRRVGTTDLIEIDESIITPFERFQVLQNDLDNELLKQNPDPVEVLKIMRKIQKREYLEEPTAA